MKQRVQAPMDPRAAPIHALNRIMPLPGADREAAAEAQLLEALERRAPHKAPQP